MTIENLDISFPDYSETLITMREIADLLNEGFIGFELNAEYLAIAKKRINSEASQGKEEGDDE